MKLTIPQKPVPVIYDARGNAMSKRAKYSAGDYEAARDTRERTLHGLRNTRSQDATEMLPFLDRVKIITYLRLAAVNNPVVAALCLRYALAVGSPSVHFNTLDGGTNDQREREVEKQLRSIMHGSGWSWHRMHKIISIEELIAGEVFAVWTGGKIQLVPSELCGSSTLPESNEIDGIFYDEEGAPTAYRFGVRLRASGNSTYSRISFEEKDGARIVDAEFVYHFGQPMRVEERRFSPKLAPVVGRIQDLVDIMGAKVTTVKNQAAMSLFFTKNFDPALFAEASALAASVEKTGEDILDSALARSTYQEIRNGQILYGEVGEDVKLLEAKMNAQDFSQFALMILDQICAPIGLFPEEVFVGYRLSSYSSARADRIRLSDTLKDIRKEREAFCDSIVSRVAGLAEVDSLEEQTGGDGVADVTYGWPIVKEIDEQKHVQAQAVALANGSKSMDQICAENGTFGDQVDGQVVRAAVRKAKMIKAYAESNYPTKAQIEKQTVTPAEILAHMPNAAAASEALNNIQTAQAAETNAEANADRAAVSTS